MRPMALQCSITVVILAQRPWPARVSGYTVLLTFVMPTTFASTLDEAHGEPPFGTYASSPSIVSSGPIAYTCLVSPPMIADSLMFLVTQLSMSPNGIGSIFWAVMDNMLSSRMMYVRIAFFIKL